MTGADDTPAPVEREVSDEELVAALRDARGFKTVAAKRLGISPATIARRAERSPSLRRAIDDIEEERLDMAESKLLVAINEGQPWAIKFLLSFKGRGRGYVETQVQEHRLTQEQAATRLSDEELRRLLALADAPPGPTIDVRPDPGPRQKEKPARRRGRCPVQHGRPPPDPAEGREVIPYDQVKEF